MDRIKESFDSLPIAACFFDKNGVMRLINRRMLAIANCLRKGGIQSLAEMHSVLQAPPANVRCLDMRLRIYHFPDGKALRFAQERITTKAGVRYTQITAADVTELIRLPYLGGKQFVRVLIYQKQGLADPAELLYGTA